MDPLICHTGTSVDSEGHRVGTPTFYQHEEAAILPRSFIDTPYVQNIFSNIQMNKKCADNMICFCSPCNNQCDFKINKWKVM